MTEYIEREAYRDLFTEERCLYSCAEIKEFVDAIPAADVQPVKHGRWIPSEDDEKVFGCSECYSVIYGYRRANYCPKCGAKMDGET